MSPDQKTQKENQQAERWSQEERECFRFEDALGHVKHADPLVVRRRLTNLLQDVGKVCSDANSKDDDVAERACRLLGIAVCDVFGLGRPFDPTTGQGVLSATWIRVLDSYNGWLEKNALVGENSQRSSPTTDQSSPSAA